MGKLRYGIIGAGGCGAGKHLPSYTLHPDLVDIVAICDLNPERADAMADRFGAEAAYTDYRKMLREEKLDLVSVATPNHVHAPAAIAALDAGCHVHCEKPAALTPRLVADMIAARDRNGKKLMIGLNNRFCHWTQFARQYIAAGRVGEIYHAKCGWRRRRGIPGKGGWFTTRKQSGGGPLIDLGVHFIDVANYLMGFPTPQSVFGQTYSKFSDKQAFNPKASGYTGTYDVEDLAVGMVRYTNGCTLELEFSWASNIDDADYNFVQLYGDKGGIRYEKGKLHLLEEINETLITAEPILPTEGNWGNVETTHFLDCILHDREVMSPAEEAAQIMTIIAALYKSAEKGREIQCR